MKLQTIKSHPFKTFFKILGLAFVVFGVWYFAVTPPTEGDWQEHLKVQSKAEFSGDTVIVRNVRNYRYGPTEAEMHPAYYDKTYDLSQIKKVWYVTEPFNENKVAAHTFLSFEFNNGDFLAITIEARKTKVQKYSIWKGMLRTYPLMYIAADERDVVLLRANLRKDNVYVYPVKFSKPENARLLLTDMLEEMNKLTTSPSWYNTFWANCTSSIVKHVNKLTPGRVSPLSWQLWLTASADELALDAGLLDTDLSIEKAREKYLVTQRSIEVGDVPEYSRLIRHFKQE
jgi:hypothetical protein